MSTVLSEFFILDRLGKSFEIIKADGLANQVAVAKPLLHLRCVGHEVGIFVQNEKKGRGLVRRDLPFQAVLACPSGLYHDRSERIKPSSTDNHQAVRGIKFKPLTAIKMVAVVPPLPHQEEKAVKLPAFFGKQGILSAEKGRKREDTHPSDHIPLPLQKACRFGEQNNIFEKTDDIVEKIKRNQREKKWQIARYVRAVRGHKQKQCDKCKP